MVKLPRWGFGEMSKYNGVLFLPPSTPSIPFMAVLTGSGGGGGGFPCQFLFHVFPYHPLHLFICLPLHIIYNLSPPREPISLPLPLPRHLSPPSSPLSLYLLIPLTYHIIPPHVPLSLPLPLPRHIRPPHSPLSISPHFRLPHPPSLSQHLPCCHSYPNMSQIIQYI